MNTITKTIIWKESILFKKQTFLIFILYYLGTIYGFIRILDKTNSAINLTADQISVYMFIYSVVNSILCGAIIICISSITEIRETVSIPLLISLRPISYIWIGQYIFVCTTTYIASFVGSITLLIYVNIFLHENHLINLKMVLLCFIIGPLIAYILISIDLFLSWVVKFTILSLVPTLLVPGIMLIFILNNTVLVIQYNPGLMEIVFLSFLHSLEIYILSKVLNILPKEIFIGNT